VPTSILCPACGSANPNDYRFCVTCGSVLKRSGNGLPAVDVRTTQTPGGLPPHRLDATPGSRKPAAPAAAPPATPERPPSPAALRDDKIVGAPVVDIASSGQVAKKFVACARCHGSCVVGTKFCKYCGAPLEDPQDARRPSRPSDPSRIEQLPPPPTSPPHGEEFEPPDTRPTERRAQASAARPPPRRHDTAPLYELDGELDAPARERVLDPGAAPALMLPDARRAEPQRQAQPRPPPSNPAGRGGGSAKPSPGHPQREDFLEAFPTIHELPEPGKRPEISQLAGSPIPTMPVQVSAARTTTRRGERKNPGNLVVIVEDGSEGRSFSLGEGQLDIGRIDGDIILEDDHYVSPRHARLRFIDGHWVLRDLDSTNHVYVRLRKPYPLKDADLLLLGLEVLQFQTVSDGERGLGHAMQHGTLLFGSPATPRRARLCQRTVEGVVRDVYHLFRDETVIGREMGDIVFTGDPFLSRRHAAIRRSPITGEFSLVDLDSSNGTYVAIRGEVSLSNGDFLRIGQHLFRVDLG
jgi:pSer/pThr/pTyr-binding forkhead associated (FHA) protein